MLDQQSPAGHAQESAGPGSPPAAAAPPAKGSRKRTFLRLGAGAALAALLFGGWWLYSRQFEETDDAQIDGDISAISSRVTGTVIAVHVVDNQPVQKGAPLVDLDPSDLQVSVLQARAAVAQAEAQLLADEPAVDITRTSNRASVSSASSDLSSAQAGLEAAERELAQLRAQLASAQAQARFARQQRERGEQLFAGAAITRADLDQRVSAADAAAASVDAAKQAVGGAAQRIDERKARLASARSHLEEQRLNAPRSQATREAGVSVRRANLDLARAQLQQAELNLGYGRITSPVAGIVGKKSVNLGDRVQPGQQLFALAQIDHLWVTANYRETQLGRLKPGQRGSCKVDALGKEFDCEVESIAGATGSRYSLLPPENATGNYVKVVQRVPVRLKLDPNQAELDRLRPGMSVEPKVRVR